MLDRRAMLLSTAATALAAPGLASGAAASGPAALNRLFDDVQAENLRRSPEQATRLGLDTGALAASRSRLDDRSLAGRQARQADVASQLARMKAFDRRSLSGMDAINYDSVLFPLEVEDAANRRFGFGRGVGSPYVLTHSSLPYQQLSQFLDTQHPVENAADADAYIARLEGMAVAIDQDTERANADAAKGVVPPDFILDLALTQLASARAAPADRAPAIAALDRKLAAKGLPATYGANGRRILAERIMPAVDRQIDALKKMRAGATSDAGVWKLRDGEAFYASALKASTTSSMTPDEAHKLGLDLAAKVTADMDAALKAQGLSQGTVGERMAALFAQKRDAYPNTDEGRAQEIVALNAKLARVQGMLPQWFKTLPKGRAEARREPAQTEAVAAPGRYQAGSLDGTRPGIVYLNLRDTAEMPMWNAQTIAYHEAVPGHHLQVTLQQEMGDLPLLRRAGGFSGYAEGWALYSEKLADEMGLYEGDPLGRIGFMKSVLFRCGRLVVDTGIHTRRWTKDQGVAHLVDSGAGFRSVMETEVNRYCTGPGQACSYMIGRLTIDGLRDKARSQLGARFNIGEFHDAVLLGGAMPLDTLATRVDAYIAQRRRA